MKNPNHYGTISHLSGNRRRPWVVREGNSGKQKPIGYAATKEEAMIMLADFNKNPWDIQAKKVTFAQLYDLWAEKRGSKLNPNYFHVLKSVRRYCVPLDNIPYSQIKVYQIQEIIDTCGKSYSIQQDIKNLFYNLDKFAIEMDVTQKRTSDLLTAEHTPDTSKVPFTEEEISKLWDIADQPWVDTVLMYLYTGFRLTELLEMKTDQVDLNEMVFRGGEKTAAGKNRIVPIHHRIQGFVKARVEASQSGYLFEINGKKISKSKYYKLWTEIMWKIGSERSPHEARHTFRTRLDRVDANHKCIDLLMGHKSGNIGERVYTHKTLQELRDTIELLN